MTILELFSELADKGITELGDIQIDISDARIKHYEELDMLGEILEEVSK